MELTPLKYFRAIAAAGHMTRAARSLGITQPALSAVVRKLEAEVGTELLHRTGRGVEPTDAGRVLLQHAEEAIRAAEGGVKAVRELMNLERGSIRVGGGATATTYLLPPVVSGVRKKYPGLRFFVREAGSAQVAAAVGSGELDLGIITLPVPSASADELLVTPLVMDELRLISPAGHPLRNRAGWVERTYSPGKRGTKVSKPKALPGVFSWKELAGEPFVAFEAGTAVRGIIDDAARAAGVTLNVVMELRSIESIKRMVAAGIGVGLVSRFALGEGEGLACGDRGLRRQLAIVRRRDRLPAAAISHFERALVETARGR
ncbi:MAG: LysR family transcriptional regulator [Phycisphaerales bacterium]|nr:LysR family transcriptional regulator [Phycisphaerales bacterium]